MRLIGYIRVSRVGGREGESFISPDVQRERVERHAAAGGHVVVDWKEDLDQPGSRMDRPDFEQALQAVERGEADGVAVARLDRFARSVVGAARALERLEAADGVLVAVDVGMDTSTSAGRLMRNVMMSLAEFELDRVRENWQVSTERAIGRGVSVSRPPFGYVRRSDGRFEADPAAAPLVREVFTRRAAGASWTELAGFLDERAPRPDRGGWTRQTVAGIVGRRTYLGEARQGDVVNVDAHPPLVTRREYELAQSRPRTETRARDGGALLAGIIVCAGCGNTLTRTSDGARGYRNYGCRKRNGATGVCADPVKVSVRRADTYVESMFLEWVDREPVTAIGEPAGGTLDLALARLDAASEELAAYRDANLVTVIGRDPYVAGLTSRQQQVDEARAAVGRANASAPTAGLRDLGRLWPDLDVAARRHLLGASIDRILVRPAPRAGKGADVADRLQIVWR